MSAMFSSVGEETNWKKTLRIGVLVLSLVVLLTAAVPCAMIADAEARGWVMIRLDLDVTLDPANEELTGKGTATLRLYDRQSSALMMALGESGEYLSFETIQGMPGSINDAGNFVVLYFDELQPYGAEVDVRFRFRSRGRAVQYVISPKGAIASWVSGWYPHSTDGGEKAPGKTCLTVPSTWKTLSNGDLTEVIEQDNLRTEVWSTDRAVARSFAAGPYHVETREVGDREVAVYLLDDDFPWAIQRSSSDSRATHWCGRWRHCVLAGLVGNHHCSGSVCHTLPDATQQCVTRAQ